MVQEVNCMECDGTGHDAPDWKHTNFIELCFVCQGKCVQPIPMSELFEFVAAGWPARKEVRW